MVETVKIDLECNFSGTSAVKAFREVIDDYFNLVLKSVERFDTVSSTGLFVSCELTDAITNCCVDWIDMSVSTNYKSPTRFSAVATIPKQYVRKEYFNICGLYFFNTYTKDSELRLRCEVLERVLYDKT